MGLELSLLRLPNLVVMAMVVKKDSEKGAIALNLASTPSFVFFRRSG